MQCSSSSSPYVWIKSGLLKTPATIALLGRIAMAAPQHTIVFALLSRASALVSRSLTPLPPSGRKLGHPQKFGAPAMEKEEESGTPAIELLPNPDWKNAGPSKMKNLGHPRSTKSENRGHPQ
jgi:hypothetical protein